MGGVISIIVPVVDEPPELFQKVVNSVLNQTYNEVQLIIVDDGVTSSKIHGIIEGASKDSRTTTCKRARTTDLRTCSEAYNLGLDSVQGDWLMLDAADDYFELDWAEKLIKFIEGREGEINGVCTNWIKHHFDGREEMIDMKINWDWTKSSLENHLTRESLGSFIFKWSWIKDIRHDERFPRSQSREYYAKVFQRGNIEHCPRFLWHFNEWRKGHWAKFASIRWRILCDLKNGFYDGANLAWGLELSKKYDPCLFYAAISAYKEFITDPKWRKDFEESKFKVEYDRVEKICWDEAKDK